jgi:hypothetical protein
MTKLWIVVAGVAIAAMASNSRVLVRDLAPPHWREGSVVVHAPVSEVRQWMKDYNRWPDRFPDIESAKVVSKENGVTTVRTRSRILGRELTLRFRDVTENEQVYDGQGPSVTVQGKNYFESLGPNETRVIMQTDAEVHGALAAFASESTQRKHAFKKLKADLGALLKLEK